MIKFDLHTHHERCGHALGTIEAYIEAAVEKGLSMIGISDHSPYWGSPEDHPDPSKAMAVSVFPEYVDEMIALKRKYAGRIEVMLGLESDFFPEHIALYRRMFESYPFDYWIGSVHRLNGLHIFNKERWEHASEEQKSTDKADYYRLIWEAADCGLFQIIGHIDGLKGNQPQFRDIPWNGLDALLHKLAETRTAIEVNVSGKLKACGCWYPSDDILERAHFYNVPITYGSDAHQPNQVGDDWMAVRDKLKAIGFTHLTAFRQKQQIAVPI